ncbi:hypothetical protein BP6252_06928 [Coleophoma cylindrospora]|uniref:2EXR domain-containing protein n=1 Tax=Coleophoma cylindrospora TaxID=1849047 RepID=A0A3D8RGM8_9HELO|nr:hypothetical protein BP6252_06928 [Coleophoma cylindrospora]
MAPTNDLGAEKEAILANHTTAMDFKYFPELPTEIRLEIWHYAILFQRVVEIKTRKVRVDDTRDRYRRYFRTPPPSLMSVNQESRNEAVQRYTLLNFTERSDILDSELWKDPYYLVLKQKDPSGAKAYAAAFRRRTRFATFFNSGIDTIFLNIPQEPLVSYHGGYSLGKFTWSKYQYHFTSLAVAARAFNPSDELLGQKLSTISRHIIRLKNVKEILLVFDEDATAGDGDEVESLTTSFTPYPAHQGSDIVKWLQERLKIKAIILNHAHKEHQKRNPHHFPMQLWVAPKVRAMRAVTSLMPCAEPRIAEEKEGKVRNGRVDWWTLGKVHKVHLDFWDDFDSRPTASVNH